MTKRRALLLIVAALILGAGALVVLRRTQSPDPIRIGVLFAQSGTMAISEQALVDATLMAVDELNAAGGVLGRPLLPVVVDGRSDWAYSAQQAEDLITRQGVNVVFGCWTSVCRRTVRPVFERLNHLLFYPVQYEGLEQSPNIVYTGAAPNEQIIPAVKWSLDNLGKRLYLVGSDYVFPRAANAIIRDQVTALRGQIVGEDYVLLGSTDVGPIIERIRQAQPDVILNTINGDSNVAFFRALRAAGITPEKIPTVSFSIAESELQNMDVASMVGDYAVWNYFQSLDTPANRAFVARFKARYGAARVTSDPIETAYFSVFLWAQAVRDSGDPSPRAIRGAIRDQSIGTPGGIVSVDPMTLHTWKIVRVGQIRRDGQFNIVWSSGNPIRPIPYPIYRPREEWDRLVLDLYRQWNGNWSNPGPRKGP